MDKLGIDSLAWFVIIWVFGGLGFFLEKFKKGLFYICLILGLICAFIASSILK